MKEKPNKKCSICGEEYKDNFFNSWDHIISKHSFGERK